MAHSSDDFCCEFHYGEWLVREQQRKCRHVAFDPKCPACRLACGYDGEDLQTIEAEAEMVQDFDRRAQRCRRCGRKHVILGIEAECQSHCGPPCSRRERMLLAEVEREAEMLDDIKAAWAEARSQD